MSPHGAATATDVLDRAAPDEAETLARAAWSLVAEPTDAAAAAVVAALGAPEALRWAAWAVTVAPAVAEAGLRERLRAGAGAGVGVPEREGAAGGPGGRAGAGAALRVLARALPRWAPRLAVLDPRPALDALAALGGSLLVPGGPGWPSGLDDLGGAAPLCLWVRGSVPLGALTRRSVALVGARAATPYGRHVASDLASGLAVAGVTVVSGGAFGIDVAAHRSALAVGGATVALLAGGVDRPSPEGNRHVLDALVDAGGALVAEVPPGSPPSRVRFLQRNRLIAALPQVTVVVEAAWRSGALSTASHAADLLRPVGAVPGPVTSMASAGCHRLLRDGQAVCVTGRDDVLELLGGPQPATGGAAGCTTLPRSGMESDPASRSGLVSDPASRSGLVSDPASRSGLVSDPASRSGLVSDPASRSGLVSDLAPRSAMASGTSPRSGPVTGADRETGPPTPPRRGPASGSGPVGPARTRYPGGSVPGRVLDALPTRRGAALAQVARRAGLSEREVAATLGALELEGAVRRTATGWSR